jgi:AcrR family transcriptional regulator
MATAASVRPYAPNRRKAAAEMRRRAILDAALEVFSEQGFAAARLDDIAARAGVAKGTIYLVCKDKEDLFQQVLLGALKPVLDRLSLARDSSLPIAEVFARLMEFFRREVLGTQRRLIAQVLVKEAGRFPALAEFHHREVVSKILAFVSEAMARAEREGVLRSSAYARFPHLVMAPMLFALVWDAAFSKFAPLDVEGLLGAHREALFGPESATEQRL